MDFAEKRLAAAIIILASLPSGERTKETATATKILGELQARADGPAKQGYAKAMAATAKALGASSPSLPWLAFTGRGPGQPPPAVELMRPPASEPEPGWWDVLSSWTGPGRMYEYFFGDGLPENAVTDIAETVTLGVVEAAVAGAGAVASGVRAFPQIFIGLLVAGGAYAYHRFKRK